MLQSIRERASGWIAWVVFVLISIPFALWGVHEYFGTDPNPPVAEVNGAEITQQQFQRAFMQQRERLRAAMGGSYDERDLDMVALRDSTLDQLVADEALIQVALDRGMRVSDQQVAAAIRAEPGFQRDGVFAQEAYEAWLRSQGLTSAGFEFQLRRSLLAEQLASGIAQTALVPAAAANRLLSLLEQRRGFSVLTLSRDEYADVDVDESTARAYYEENRREFVTPERVVARYVLLSQPALAATIEVSEEELRESYESRKGNLVTPAQRRASHILLQVPPDADQAEVTRTRERIAALRDRILGGEDFADVAAEASEDPGSAAQGGDLGFFGRGIMDAAFEDAAFSQAVGEVGEPVRSDFGYHLILVTEAKDGEAKSFDEVRAQLLGAIRQERVEQRFFEQVERLANLSFEHPDSLEPAADSLGLEIRSTKPFTRDGIADDELFSRPAVTAAAFSEEVLERGNNSDPVDLGDGRVLVLRVDERLPAADQSFEEARSSIVNRLRDDLVEKALREAAAALLARLRGGDDRNAVADALGSTWQDYQDMRRGGGGVDPLVLEAAFRMPRSQSGSPVYDAVQTIDGDFAVVALQSVTSGQETAGRAPAEIRQAVTMARGRHEFSAFIESVRDTADVKVFQDALANAL